MNSKTWSIFAAVCVIFLGGLVVISQKDRINVSEVNTTAVVKASSNNGNIADHVFGDKTSKVLLTEYGDFQCPYCGQAYPNVKTLTDKYQDKLAFVFRNNPMPTLHPNARAAAAAAEAAGLQGKYWEMHDKLYESQNSWNTASADKRTDLFVQYAKAIGVKNTDKFKLDMASKNVNRKIDFDLALGKKDKVAGTPSFFLNGKLVPEDVSSSLINGDGSVADKYIESKLK